MATALRKIVAERAQYCCEYCLSQERFSPDPFSIEHIIPKSKGGKNTETNLAFACQGCNSRKYTKTTAVDPISGKVVPVYHPRKHRWADHFTWDSEHTQVLGLTPIGRATTAALQLNRNGVINLRKVLVTARLHPPG